MCCFQGLPAGLTSLVNLFSLNLSDNPELVLPLELTAVLSLNTLVIIPVDDCEAIALHRQTKLNAAVMQQLEERGVSVIVHEDCS